MIFFQGFDCQVPFLKDPTQILGGGNSKIFYFHPYLGKWSNFTNIFQMGWNHQLEMIFLPVLTGPVSDTTREMMRISGELSMEPRTDRGEQVWRPREMFTKQKFQTLKNGFLPPRSARCWGGRKKDVFFFLHQYWWRCWTCYWYFIWVSWMIFHWFSAVIIFFF